MKAVNVRQLKNNPSEVLREARKHPVVVLNRDQPEALLAHLDDEALLAKPGVRRALATALHRDESLSLGQAARLARLSGRRVHPARLAARRSRGAGNGCRRAPGCAGDRGMAKRLVAANASR